MSLSEADKRELHQLYCEIVKYYIDEIKGHVISSERFDSEQRLSIPAIIEIRSAFEHTARAHALIEGIVDEDEILGDKNLSVKQYCETNLDKAYAHLCRAGHDAFDSVGVNLVERIDFQMQSISSITLYKVIPDALEKIVKPYHKAKSLFTKAKRKKDIGSREDEEKQFRLYEEAADILRDILDFLNESMRALSDFELEQRQKEREVRLREIEREKEERRHRRTTLYWTIGTGIVSAIVGVILGIVLAPIFG